VVYKLSASGQEAILHIFNGSLGGGAQSGVILDAAGNLYGTASDVVYKLSAAATARTPQLLSRSEQPAGTPPRVWCLTRPATSTGRPRQCRGLARRRPMAWFGS
jgi:hypothetical protein